ncbi:MAG: CCA tRNA nucleotidyltransferase [Sulfurospirillum sp.]|nr:CCA tRNA nucleotidyltransferase [Sulfurospirillum sp.]
MIFIRDFPPHLQQQIDAVITFLSPYTKRAYFVGGCVRDLLLGCDVIDIDIEVYDIDPQTFDMLMCKFGALGVGKSFFVYKFQDIDLSLPRLEQKNGVGHSAFSVRISQDEKEASKRRDFAMNALMLNIFNGVALDFWGGESDIKKKCIKLIDEQAFREDSLRVLRAVQFAARFDFSIDAHTLLVMQSIDISDLSMTRIFWELEKFFKAKFLHVGLLYFYKLGMFERIFGLHVSPEAFEKIIQELTDVDFEEEFKEYYLLFIICGVLGVHVKSILQKLQAPKRYFNTFKYQPFIPNPSQQELYTIAIQMPIKQWLGNYKKPIKQEAKNLDIFDVKYTGGVSVHDVIVDGFEKEAIAKEYARRVLETIKPF